MPLGRFIKHKQQHQDKYAVEISIHRALNVVSEKANGEASSSPSLFFIKYKRGSSHHGSSSRSTAVGDSRSVKFDNCIFSFPCTLYYNTPSKKDYEQKSVSLFLNEDTGSEGQRCVGTVNINLAEYAKGVDESGKSFQLTETLAKKKSAPLRLQLTLTLKRTYDGSNQATPAPQNGSEPSLTATSSASDASCDDLSSLASSVNSAADSPSRKRGSDDESDSVPSGSTTPRELSSLSITLPSQSYNSSAANSNQTSPRSRGNSFSTSPMNMHPLSATPPHVTSIGRRLSTELNTQDITKKLAARYPELCGGAGKEEGGGVVERASDHRRTRSDLNDMRDLHSRLKPRPYFATSESELTVPIRKVSLPSPVTSPGSTSDEETLRSRLMKQEQELAQLKQELAVRQQQDDERFLIDEIVSFMNPTYGKGGVPVSAYIIFRALLYWRAFLPNNTRFLVHLTEAFDRLLTRHKADADVLLYWLSATASLLYLFRRELQVISFGGGTPTPTAAHPESSSVKVFEGQLFSFASSFFNLYCKLFQEQLGKVITELINSASDPNADTLSVWDHSKLISALSAQRDLLNKCIPFEGLREQIMRAGTFYIGGRMFNEILEMGNKRSTICRCSHGVGLKMVFVEIEDWFDGSTWPGAVAACRKNLALARQAADVLIVNKSSLGADKTRKEVCPALSSQQLVTLLESYIPDELDPEPVHPGVITAILSTDRDLASTITQRSQQQSQEVPRCVLVDINVGAELETHFTSTGACDLTTAPIPTSVSTRPGFAFLRSNCTDNTPW